MSRSLLLLLATAALVLGAPISAEAQVCRKGKPCGNTCIARSKTCRVGAGTARAAGQPAPTQAPAATAAPEGAMYVASSRGRVYYWVGCSAWRSLSPANLRFFSSRAEAVAAGYRPSLSSRCAGPEEQATTAPAAVGEAGTSLSGPIEPGAACTVSSVVDGDTLDCADGRRIRLLLIDAPEMGQGSFGGVAKAALEQLAPAGETLAVENDVELQDRYGRVLAHLYRADGASVNQGLLEAGVAIVSVYPPNVNHVEAYRAAQETARQAGRGLWAVKAFECTPADFRAGRCGSPNR